MLDLVLGRTCAGCDEPGLLLCASCERALQPRVRLRRDLDVGDVMAGLRIPVVCALDYRGVVRQVLYRYKDHRIRQLARALSPALSASVIFAAEQVGVSPKQTVLTPMPTRRSSLRRRGFDATALLVEDSAKRLTPGRIRHLLVDTRTAGAAKHAGAFEREQRAIDAFRVRRQRTLPQQPVILVDDIVTTGATVKEAVETLLVAGVQVVAVATVAGTP
jgi:predicted amidophosphoribosyltransferase